MLYRVNSTSLILLALHHNAKIPRRDNNRKSRCMIGLPAASYGAKCQNLGVYLNVTLLNITLKIYEGDTRVWKHNGTSCCS